MPLSESEKRVALSKDKNFRHTRDNEFLVRVSETNASMFDRRTSGKSFIEVPAISVDGLSWTCASDSFADRAAARLSKHPSLIALTLFFPGDFPPPSPFFSLSFGRERRGEGEIQ